MADLPNCPKCNSEYTYEDENHFNCPECAHEWTLESNAESRYNNYPMNSAHSYYSTATTHVECVCLLKKTM